MEGYTIVYQVPDWVFQHRSLVSGNYGDLKIDTSGYGVLRNNHLKRIIKTLHLIGSFYEISIYEVVTLTRANTARMLN